jgi:hypothetical protein
MNETTEKNANTICDYLEIAYEKDPQQPLPVKEYERLVFELGRDNLLKNAIAMEQEAVAYREKEVYHLFEDVKVVGDGAAERSYDPVNQSINLMAPYKDEGEWSWLIQASKNPSILEDYEAVSKTEPIPIENGHVWINDWYEDGIYHIDAILNEGERWLYIHDVAANEKDLKYLKECIKQSGFLPLN